MSKALAQAFATDGLLAAAVPDYRSRPEQLEMAQAIHESIERTGVLVAEAGTGTGKTFAYLVPALLAGGKVIVSTGTKTLQDQLYDRDLPAVRKALGSGAAAALLKGRANYVCLYRLRRSAASGVGSREEAAQLRRIGQFALATTSGAQSMITTSVIFFRRSRSPSILGEPITSPGRSGVIPLGSTATRTTEHGSR